METNRLAEFFNKQREVIEAAETPFAKLAIFILPILAPIVPASLTGLHVYKLMLEIFTFSHAYQVSVVLSAIVALVLEMLGYVGAISFVQAVFRLVKTRNTLYLLPAILNGLSYTFYLVLMFLVNYKLGEYFQTPRIINTIVGLLSFVTVPTGLLAANYLSQKEIKEDEREMRKERSAERLERARIKAGNLPQAEKVSKKLPKQEESYQKLSSDWRKVSKQLSEEQLQFMVSSTPSQIAKAFLESGLEISPRTASNWRTYAYDELQVRMNGESNE